MRNAPSRSCKEAVVTTTASNSPPASTATCRLRPLIFFPPSYPLLAVGTVSAARTVCESITAAVSPGPRPSARRARSRSAAQIRHHARARVHRRDRRRASQTRSTLSRDLPCRTRIRYRQPVLDPIPAGTSAACRRTIGACRRCSVGPGASIASEPCGAALSKPSQADHHRHSSAVVGSEWFLLGATCRAGLPRRGAPGHR